MEIEESFMKEKHILVVLEESKLRDALQASSLTAHWVFASSIPNPLDIKKFSIVYSDIPELVSLASKSGLRTIVAYSRDTCENVILKLTRVLRSL
jgi:hypothetical protein